MSRKDVLDARDRLARVAGTNDQLFRRGDVLALVSDLEWALDEVERLREQLEAAAKARKVG